MKKKNKEIWRPIQGFEGLYEISNIGRVKSLPRTMNNRYGTVSPIKERIRKFSYQKCGYLQVTLCAKGKSYYKWVHRLVAFAFLTEITGKNYVNHKDGNKHNNTVENLEFCTTAENNAHAGKMNLKPIGTEHTNSKFTKEDLIKIRELLNLGWTHKRISYVFKVHRTTISRFAKNETYIKEYINEK